MSMNILTKQARNINLSETVHIKLVTHAYLQNREYKWAASSNLVGANYDLRFQGQLDQPRKRLTYMGKSSCMSPKSYIKGDVCFFLRGGRTNVLGHLHAHRKFTKTFNARLDRIRDTIAKNLELAYSRHYVMSYGTTNHASKRGATHQGPDAPIRNSSSAIEGDIDPITNRRRIQLQDDSSPTHGDKERKSIAVPVTTFKGYRSFQPVETSSKAKSEDITMSRNDKILEKSDGRSAEYRSDVGPWKPQANKTATMHKSQRQQHGIGKLSHENELEPNNHQKKSEHECEKQADVRDRKQQPQINKAKLFGNHSENVSAPNSRLTLYESQASNDDILTKSTPSKAATSPTSNTRQTLSGNFVRDFPEEFTDAWCKDSTSGSLISRSRQHGPVDFKSQSQEIRNSRVRDGDGNLCMQQALQPALDRLKSSKSGTCDARHKNHHDPADYSVFAKAVEGEASKSVDDAEKNLARDIRGIYEQHYGVIDCDHRQLENAKNFKTTESTASSEKSPSKTSNSHQAITKDTVMETPTLYKVLAYDPTFQTVTSASTSSIVSDYSTAVSPAEVLLRLSNPAKFFPHFEPLHKDGYEIISGAGDVLVFRKVRKAIPSEASSTVKNISSASSTGQPPAERSQPSMINPIDGTVAYPHDLSVVTGNYASPTGFVNHDLPFPEESLADYTSSKLDSIGGGPTERTSRFKSGIDMRREEEVFSGRSNWTGTGEVAEVRSRRRFLKRALVTAASVGVSAYTIGWLMEHF